MQLMIDLETLSLKSDAAVTAIGLAVFDDARVVETKGYGIRSQDWDGHIDPSTIKWWMEQSDSAREAAFNGKLDAKSVVMSVLTVLDQYKPTAIWANDPSFDVVILKHWWYRHAEMLRFPVSYKNERSCRTVFDLAKHFDIDYSGAFAGAVAHDPVSDAACQARAVLIVQREIQHRMGSSNVQRDFFGVA